MTKEEKVEETKEETNKEFPKEYYVAEIVTSTSKVIAFNGEQISPEELLVKVANAVDKAGLLKE